MCQCPAPHPGQARRSHVGSSRAYRRCESFSPVRCTWENSAIFLDRALPSRSESSRSGSHTPLCHCCPRKLWQESTLERPYRVLRSWCYASWSTIRTSPKQHASQGCDALDVSNLSYQNRSSRSLKVALDVSPQIRTDGSSSIGDSYSMVWCRR